MTICLTADIFNQTLIKSTNRDVGTLFLIVHYYCHVIYFTLKILHASSSPFRCAKIPAPYHGVNTSSITAIERIV